MDRPHLTLPAALSVLRNRDFRLYWSGQAVSLTGAWARAMAQSWHPHVPLHAREGALMPSTRGARWLALTVLRSESPARLEAAVRGEPPDFIASDRRAARTSTGVYPRPGG